MNTTKRIVWPLRLMAAVGASVLATVVITAILSLTAFSQEGGDLPRFNSGSIGSDGPLIIQMPGEYHFNPRDPSTFDPAMQVPNRAVLDANGDGVYHFTTIMIGAGVTVKLSGARLGTKPVVWLAIGDVDIEGTIDLNGENGHSSVAVPKPSIAGAGGYWGSVGGDQRPPIVPVLPGEGPGGGKVNGFGEGIGSGAGHAFQGSRSADIAEGGSAYGNDFLLPLLGGSGGSGALGSPGAGGGAGGGALLIASSTSIVVNGTIMSNGGDGGLNEISQPSGGGGSGGAIRLVAPSVSGNGSLRAKGGNGYASCCGNGSSGRVRVEAFENSFKSSGSFDLSWGGGQPGKPSFSTPGPVFPPFPPTQQPSVRVLSIASVEVPPNPIGDLLRPDMTIDSASNAQIQIQAQNIPSGTQVQLNIFSENGLGQVVRSTPLDMSGRATAVLTLPPGISRFHVQAIWTP